MAIRRIRAGRVEPAAPTTTDGHERPRLPKRTLVRVRRQALEIAGLEHHSIAPFDAIVMDDRGDAVVVGEHTLRRGTLYAGTRTVRPRYIAVRRKQPDLDKSTAKQARAAGLVLARLFPRPRRESAETESKTDEPSAGNSSAE